MSKGPGGKGVGPDLDWLREVREQAAKGGAKGGAKGKSKGKSKDGDFRRSRSRSGGRRSRSRSRSRSRGGKGGKGGKKGKGDKGDKGGRKDNPESSRNLFMSAPKSRARSGSSSSSSSRGKRAKERLRTGAWDSTAPPPDAKPEPAPVKKKNEGLRVKIGAKVDIHSLEGAAQYNGLEGRVAAGPNGKGRWKVELVFQGDLKEMSFKPENLTPKPSCGWELVVAAISESSTEADVTAAFKQFGTVQGCKVTRDTDGVSKGVALIVMTSKHSAEKALQHAASQEIKVNRVPAKVQWSTMVKQQMGLLTNRDDETGAEEPKQRTFQERPASNLSTSGPFGVGQHVTIDGLKSAAQYNGTVGVVQGYRPDGRCEVLLKTGGEEKTLALKVDNLSKSDAPSESDPAAGGADPKTADQGNEDAPKCRRFSEVPAELKPAEKTAEAKSQPVTNDTEVHAGDAKPSDTDIKTNPAEDDNAPKRRRKSLWDGEKDSGKSKAAAPPQKEPVSNSTEATAAEPLPDAEALDKMSAKDLKRLLQSHKVDTAGCFEKSEFLEKARALVKR